MKWLYRILKLIPFINVTEKYTIIFTKEEYLEGHGVFKKGEYKGHHVIIMDEKEYQEWKEFVENIFVVYENKEDLKKDFPDSEPIKETFITADEYPFPPKEKIRKKIKSDFPLNKKECFNNDCSKWHGDL
jgi:hypothetical protein